MYIEFYFRRGKNLVVMRKELILYGTELSDDELKKQKKDLMDRINNNLIVI